MRSSHMLTSFVSIFSGMVLFLLQRFFKNQQKKEEMRDLDKATQNALILKSLNALVAKSFFALTASVTVIPWRIFAAA